MNILARCTLSTSAAAVLLAGCGGSQAPISLPGGMPESNTAARPRVTENRNRRLSSSYRVLYSFMASPDGAQPDASLLDVKGTLYGTTASGGSNCGSRGCGTVFRITRGGAEKVLYSFSGAPGAVDPTTALVDVGGTLYGTTSQGGTGYRGTVFSVTMSGAESLLHSFGGKQRIHGKRDGERPGGVIDVGGTLYGTTLFGGYGEGIVFSLTTEGLEKVLRRFRRGNDGAAPSSLNDVKGTLYGTTLAGGAHGHGTVFSITTRGMEKVLYSFGGSPDGARPTGGLIDVDGTLYGTTNNGGEYNSQSCNYQFTDGCGTVYSISTSGSEKVLHSFGNGHDGSDPNGSLIDVNGTLYGTTSNGGTHGHSGTIFSITPGGKEKVLHSFGNGTDGKQPFAGLIDVNGTLYGTTAGGGTSGYGTVFALTP